MTGKILDKWSGVCPICDARTEFYADNDWYRDHLFCARCPKSSIPRERALMLVLRRLKPNWRFLKIHESSPAPRGVSLLLAEQCAHYTASQFFPGVEPGAMHNGFRCEDLEHQTFPDQFFDVVITQDVMEHVFRPDLAYREIYRTLRPGGLHIHTTPIYAGLAKTECKAQMSPDGTITHLTPPEYHGNPINSSGSLVTFHYGHDLPDLISQWAPFSVEVTRFHDRHQGILGEFTEVISCRRN